MDGIGPRDVGLFNVLRVTAWTRICSLLLYLEHIFFYRLRGWVRPLSTSKHGLISRIYGPKNPLLPTGVFDVLGLFKRKEIPGLLQLIEVLA